MNVSHFTKVLGDELLIRMLDDGPEVQPGDFGFHLKSEQMEAHLAAICEAHKLYLRDHSAELATLPALQ